MRVDFSRFATETNDVVVTGAVDGPPGSGITSYLRRTRKAGGTVSGRGFSLTSGNLSDASLALDSGCRVTPGETITLSMYVRMGTTGMDWRFFVRFATAGSTAWQGGNVTSAQQNAQPGKWRLLTGQFVVPAGVDRFAAIAGMAATTAPAGETYDATGLMFVHGKYSGVYCDGATPGWKWDGADGLSTSVGYPYTLGSLVGQPIILFEGAFPADIAIPVPSRKTRGYTAYAVCTVGSGTTRDTLIDGTSANQRIHITYGDGGQRWNMYQSASSFTGVVNDANTRRVIGARFDVGNSRFTRDGVQGSAGGTGSAPQAATALRIGANAANGDPWKGTIEAVLLFDQAHTNEQMLAVTRWLGLRYGQAVA